MTNQNMRVNDHMDIDTPKQPQPPTTTPHTKLTFSHPLHRYTHTHTGMHAQYAKLTTPTVFVKHSAVNNVENHAHRCIVITPDLTQLHWTLLDSTAVRGSVMTNQITSVDIGHSQLSEVTTCACDTCLCISLNHNKLHIEAPSTEQRDAYIVALQWLMSVVKSNDIRQRVVTQMQQTAGDKPSLMTSLNTLCTLSQATKTFPAYIQRPHTKQHLQDSLDTAAHLQYLRRAQFDLRRWQCDVQKTAIWTQRKHAVVQREYVNTQKQHGQLKNELTALVAINTAAANGQQQNHSGKGSNKRFSTMQVSHSKHSSKYDYEDDHKESEPTPTGNVFTSQQPSIFRQQQLPQYTSVYAATRG